MNLYVENLSPKTSIFQIRMAFERYGQVDKIVREKQSIETSTNCSCYVKMTFDKQGAAAIKGLNGKELGGFTLAIKEAEL